MATYLPPGWPTGVQPPGSEGFERTAVAWLLDVVPPDYRLYGVLRRHPVALATMARHHVAACVEGARQGYRTARTELGGQLPPPGLDAVLAAYRDEGSRLVATARAVDLVARALRGERFTPRLAPAGRQPGPQEAAGRQMLRPRAAEPPAPAPARERAGVAPRPRAAEPPPASSLRLVQPPSPSAGDGDGPAAAPRAKPKRAAARRARQG